MDNYKKDGDEKYSNLSLQAKEYQIIEPAKEETVQKPGVAGISFDQNYKMESGGCIYCTPFVDDKYVYFGACDGHMYCVDKEGKLEWKFLTGDLVTSSPVMYKERIYFGSHDGYLYCLGKDGNLVWKFLTGSKIAASPVIVSGMVLFGSGDMHMYCLDADTGELAWVFETGGELVASPVINGNTLFIGSGDANMYALDINDRHILWTFRVGNKETGSVTNVQNKIIELDRKVLKIWQPETRRIGDDPSQENEGYAMKKIAFDNDDLSKYGNATTTYSSAGNAYKQKREYK